MGKDQVFDIIASCTQPKTFALPLIFLLRNYLIRLIATGILRERTFAVLDGRGALAKASMRS